MRGTHAHLDRLTRDQLQAADGPAAAVAGVLDEWNHRTHGVLSGSHNVGLFLDLLEDAGYQVSARTPGPIGGETAEAILVAHQRRDFGSCLCGWSELGKSHPGHQVAMLREAGYQIDPPG